MTRAKKVPLLAGIILLTGLAACDEGLPTPGALQVSLTTPNAGDAGMLFTLMGDGVTDVSAVSSTHQVHWRLISDMETRILVMGNLATGPLVTVEVLDVERSSAFSGIVLQVTDRDNELRDSFVGYEFGITRAVER